MISQCRALGLTDIFPLLFADSKGRRCLMSGSVISGSGGEHSYSVMEVIILSWSGLYLPLLLPATPDTARSCFPPLLPPGISPTMGLMSWHLPLCANVSFYPLSCPPPSPYPPLHPPSSSSVSTSYNHWTFLSSSMSKSNSPLFPLAAQAHTVDLVSQVPRGTLQPFYLETKHRKISMALSWNMSGRDGIFICQNLTSLYWACTNCKDSNA